MQGYSDVFDPQDPSHGLSHSSAQHHALKKRKADRACDACRRKKARCDGPKMPNNYCSNCLQSGKACTYNESSKPRGPPKAYIIGLENKMEKMEALLRKLCPDTDFSEELGPPVIRDSWKNDSRAKSETPSFDIAKSVEPALSHRDLRSNQTTDDHGVPLHLLPGPKLSSVPHIDQKRHRHRGGTAPDSDSSVTTDESLLSSSDSEQRAQSPNAVLTQRGTDGDDAQYGRFHGRPSVFGLVDDSIKYRQNLLKESEKMNVYMQPCFPSDDPTIPHTRRAKFWRVSKWEWDWEHTDTKKFHDHILGQFPSPKLASSLIKLYFGHVNIFFPLLHRPTFERQYEDRSYEQDIWFACVCHALFALSSRWSNDPQVVPRNARTQDGVIDWSKAGWDYFNLVLDIHRQRRSLFLPATLFEMQAIVLTALFLRYSSLYPASWVIIGVGFRKAQDIGAHRKKMYHEKPTVDCELWKRCFWLLVMYDILGATTLGRPCCVGQEDYDLDLPLEVDDEHWESDDPAVAFKQPDGVPSRVTMFNYAIKIGRIMVFTQKTLYATNKSVSFVPKTRARKEQLLKQIETAIDEWLNSLPDHLRWTETAGDSLISSQSALLSLYYYVTQLIVYRPFIVLPSTDDVGQADRDDGTSHPIAMKAMSISTAAARAIVRMMKAQSSYKIKHMAGIFHASHYAAGQLLLRLWYLKTVKARKETKDPMKDSSSSSQTVEMVNEEILLAREIDELLADLRTVVNIYEQVQERWEFVRPILERLRESMAKDGEMTCPEVLYQPVQQHSNYVQVPPPQYTIPLLPRDTAEFVCFSQPHDQQTFPSSLPTKIFSADYPYASPQVSFPETPQSYDTVQQSIQIGSSARQIPPYGSMEFQKSMSARVSPFAPFDDHEAGSSFIPDQDQNISYSTDYRKGMATQSSLRYGNSGTATQIASVAFDRIYPRGVQEDHTICSLCGGEPTQCSLAACATINQEELGISKPEGIFGTTSEYLRNIYSLNATANQPYGRRSDIPLDNGISSTLPRFLDRYSDTNQRLSPLAYMASQAWPIDDPCVLVNHDNADLRNNM